MIRRRLTALVVLAAAAAAFAAAVLLPTSGSTTAPGTGSTTASVTTGSSHTTSTKTKTVTAPPAGTLATPAGTYRVASRSLTITEPAAGSTPTGHNAAGQPVRTLPTTVFYPEAKAGSGPDYADGPFPLVVFSQGFNISATVYNRLLQQWASAGFVVAAPTYPFTDPASSPYVSESDIVYHPGDLRYVITVLKKNSQRGRNLFHGLVNPARVGIIGHSDGGDVSLAVAANSCCMDPAVGAAVILSGAELSSFGGTYYPPGTPPLMVVQGDADTINPPGCSVQIYAQAPRPRYFLDIPGAGHKPPYMNPGPWRTGVVKAVVAFFNAYLKRNHSTLRALKHSGALPGGETLTSVATLPNEPTQYCPGAP